VLFSDTGGGHRSAAEALIEAWHAEHPGHVQTQMSDLFRAVPFPFNQMGPSYPWMIRYCSGLYGAGFHCSDGPRRAWAIARAGYGYVRHSLHRFLTEHPADVIVSVHPAFNHSVSWALADLGLDVPFVTVVTDLWTGHALWYYPHVRRLIVPTEGARQRGIRFGVPPGRILVRGLPVARRFTAQLRAAPDRARLRAELGLAPGGKVVLLVGGGEGMGPLEYLARALDSTLPAGGPPTQVVVIAGRNAALRARLDACQWRHPVRVEGFVTNMPAWMAAADVLVTKAGPGTITEALLSELPLLLMGKVPGQEDGNVDYVVAERVGVWEPNPARAAALLASWLAPGNPALAEMSIRARGLANPDAASAIARDVLTVAAEAGRGNSGHVTAATPRPSSIRREGATDLTQLRVEHVF
jgi:1,2-diacylglycerol 3-beta-galactosyltransferase